KDRKVKAQRPQKLQNSTFATFACFSYFALREMSCHGAKGFERGCSSRSLRVPGVLCGSSVFLPTNIGERRGTGGFPSEIIKTHCTGAGKTRHKDFSLFFVLWWLCGQLNFLLLSRS